MIKVEYLAGLKGASRHGTCASCGKDSDKDVNMVRVLFTYTDGGIERSTTIHLCSDCRRECYKKI